MTTPTRFPNGITNNKASDSMANLPILDPTRVFEFFDDFVSFDISGTGLVGWHLDATGTPTAAVSDAQGGLVTLTTQATAGGNAHYQRALDTTVSENFEIVAGKRAWLHTRFKVSDADQCMPQIGLHVAADDPWATEPADQFLFRTLTADKDALEFAVGATNSTEVAVALGNLADDTFVECIAYYDGKDTVHVARLDANGVVANTGSADVTTTTAGDLLPDTEMTVAVGIETGDAAADVLTIDYIHVVRER